MCLPAQRRDHSEDEEATVRGHPTGEQHVLHNGDQRAVVVEVGGGLREYVVAGRPVVDGYDASARVDGGRGQLLVPWPNRVRDGRYRWASQDLQLPLTEVANHNAIHGLLRWTSWSLVERADERVVLGATVWPQPGYPFLLAVQVAYVLGPQGLVVTVTARNDGDEAAPYGVGQHPYVTVGTDLVDEALLTLPAQQWVRSDERGIPVATEPVAGTAYDFRAPRAIGTQRLDTAFAGLLRDPNGHAVVRLEHPAGGRAVELWLGAGADYLQVFTGDTLPDPTRRRRGLAVEPMSCAADAFRSGTGLVTLGPGDRHELTWGMRLLET